MEYCIENYGLTESFKKQINNINLGDSDFVGRVIEVHKGQFMVISNHGERRAILKSSMFFKNEGETFPSVGDFVILSHNPTGEDIILKVLERSSLFSRMDSFNKTQQVVASNFDYVLILTSPNQEFNVKRLDRYLVSAWESGAIPVVVLTKSDLSEDIERYIKEIEEIAMGVDVFPISSVSLEGIQELRDYFKKGSTMVLLGSSGVGKSSLVNALAGKNIMKVKEIREDDSKGKHTTTHRQMIFLDSGIMVIDTPGMRELELWSTEYGLDRAFEDIDKFSESCRFKDCNHDNEPGCRVKAALESGELSLDRWISYQKLKKESRYAKSKMDSTIKMEEKAKWKSINKQQRQLYKNK